jgi:hypothetical protein
MYIYSSIEKRIYVYMCLHVERATVYQSTAIIHCVGVAVTCTTTTEYHILLVI